jgi:predicted GIY-YIG superfamily endonuclease
VSKEGLWEAQSANPCVGLAVEWPDGGTTAASRRQTELNQRAPPPLQRVRTEGANSFPPALPSIMKFMDLSAIPHSPGVYLMRDKSGHTLYVGKARDLAKRVASYFGKGSGHTAKTAALVASINHVDYLPAESEREALIMERSLIRQMQPHFNTMWRDDKSYPYVKLTWNEDYPRLFMTRKVL